MTALFASMTFLFAGNALIVSSIGVILKENKESSLAVGVLSSCFFIGALIGTIGAHKIISRIGHIRSFGLFGAVFGISAMLHTLSENLVFWAILRFFIGICYYGLLMVIESWLNEKSKNAVRSRILGFYEIVFYLAFGIGILIIALDLKGKQFSSEEFSKNLEEISMENSHITFIIGGSLGLTDELLNKCNQKICFSKMTFPHQLIRVFLLEQIFRAFKISNGETYHR